MSDFKFNCPHCSQHLEAPEELLGQAIQCPSCNGPIRLPEPKRVEMPNPPTIPRNAPLVATPQPRPGVSRRKIVLVAVTGLLFFILNGRTGSAGNRGSGKASIEVEYTSGSGAVAGAFDKSAELELTDVSFDGRTVVFNYKNLNDDKVGGWTFGVIVTTYTKDGVEVDTVEKMLYPGEVYVPCTGKIITIPTDTKQQGIARVTIEHVGAFSQSRFKDGLDRMMGR
jgi:hypothetical protein